jgi:hypothetical protein
MPTNNGTVFTRLNFFTGFFTTAEDWLQGQEYHLEKRKLHLRGLHTPGIIPGEGDPLKVTAYSDLEVQVNPGAALDGEGNLLYLPAATKFKIKLPEDLTKPVYVYIKYAEDRTHPQQNVDYPEYSGRSRVTEYPEICSSPDKPKPAEGVVLARITLKPDENKIGKVDTSMAEWAGAVDRVRDALAAKLDAQLAEVDAAQLAQQRCHNKGLHAGAGRENRAPPPGRPRRSGRRQDRRASLHPRRGAAQV